MKNIKLSAVFRSAIFIFLATLLVSACSETGEGVDPLNSTTNADDGPENAAHLARIVLSENRTPPKASEFKEIDWADLIPKDNLESLQNPPIKLNDIENLNYIWEGSTEEQINELRKLAKAAGINPFKKPVDTTKPVADMDNQAIRIPGFIVPLEFNDDKEITQFFLVPYFGACIHVPPPPPNQIVFVNYPKGLKLRSLYDPFWISGVMKTALTENDTATSAYSMELHNYEDYML